MNNFSDKKSAISLFVLFVLLLLLPLGIYFIRERVSFLPRAAGELIQLGEGGCIVQQNGKKAVDCTLVPIKLTNPFFNINPGASVTPNPSTGTNSPAVSPTPIPSASAGTPQNVNVASFNNNIQQALDSIKTTGGSVYLPAGTYDIPEKIRIYSNITLFGDGMGSTVIKFEDSAPVDDMMANDSSAGQQNIVIRDLTLKGPANPEYVNNCCYGLKLENLNNAFVINVEANDFGMDGMYLGYKHKNGVPLGVKNSRITGCKISGNGRVGVYLADTDNVIVDRCTITGNGKFERLGGIIAGPDNGTSVQNSKILDNVVTHNPGNGIRLGSCHDAHKDGGVHDIAVCNNTAYPNDFPALRQDKCNSEVRGNIFINNVDNGEFENSGGGEILTSPQSACDILGNLNSLPSAPSKPSADNGSFLGNFIETVSAQDSDDVFTNAEDPDSSDQFILGSGNPAASGGGVKYRLSESQAGLASAQWKDFGSAQTLNTAFELSSKSPGAKQIWVEFLHSNGTTNKTDNINFFFLDENPQIVGLSCNLDISKENLKITIEGFRFGTNIGTVESVSPAGKPEVLGWNETQITAFLKKPNIPVAEGQKFKIKVKRPDGVESPVATCAVDKSLVSFGARIFCREPGKFDAKDVIVDILYNPENSTGQDNLVKIQEKVTINADGTVSNLKTKLQVGKNYAIAIKAPSSVRRTAVFTAREGTTEILNPEGKPFILPIGDIAPVINPDGSINTLDRAELIRQWRILGKETNANLSGDFNRDSRVNSIDWACMNYDFGSEDDLLPVSIPQPASGTLRIPSSGQGILKIPVSSGSSATN